MNTNIIEVYYNFCKRNLLSYNRLLLKYLNIEDDLLEKFSIEVVDKIVSDCYEKKYSNNIEPEVINIDLEIMLSLPKKRHRDLDLVLAALSKQIIVHNELQNNINLVHLYRILSNSILIAIELNERTCSIASRGSSFKEVISSILDKHGNYLEKDVITKLSKPMPLLKNEYNTKSKIIDKLIIHYDSNKIDFDGFEIRNLNDQTKWFQILPSYNFEKLKLTGKRKVSTIVSEQNNFKDIIFILIDKINYELLKQLVLKKQELNYVITLPNDFIKSKTNVIKLIKLLDNNNSKKYIYLEIDYSQLRKYEESFQKLKSKNISIIVSKFKKQYSKELVEQINYIALDKNEFNDQKLMKMVNDNHMFIIFDQELNDNDYSSNIKLVRNQFNSKVISKEKMV